MKWTSLFKGTAGLLWMSSLLCAQPQPNELTNETIQAQFGLSGLVSVRETRPEAAPQQFQDSWSLSIDEDVLRSSDAVPSIQGGDHQLTYAYAIREYRIEVVYRLEQNWHFVSKTVQVVHAPHATYTVHEVTPSAITLAVAAEGVYVPTSYIPQLGNTIAKTRVNFPARDFGLFLRRNSSHDGLMLVAQNPFLQVEHEGRNGSLHYEPQMSWKQAWGPFLADAVCIGPYQLTGEILPREMLLEWKLPATLRTEAGMDRGEIQAFTDCVRAFLIHPSPTPTSVEVGWTLNDYQIDVGTDAGKAEYKHIIDATSELGIKTLLYAPTNNALARRDDDTDSWHWEHTLWLNLGQKIRKGDWDPVSSPIPADVQTMLSYAQSRHVGLLAYVYPSVPFQGNRTWLVDGSGHHEKNLQYATMSSRELQDLYIRDLIAFKRRTGIAGYSFDYAFLDLQGSSSYSQWQGWRRVMEELRKAEPEVIIDGRQSYQLYGPWSWLAGSYPHPTGQDEQPESFIPYPDLHFDRVSADRTRFVNYWYRNYQFAPAEIVPGYATHQTERSRNVPSDEVTGGHPERVEEVHTAFRVRDWDYLGYRYSFLSSIGTAGWNNVVDMIPARDPEERKSFSQADKDWIRDWLDWANQNKDYLRHTRSILHQPEMGKLDGTSAIVGGRGYLFLFNPNYKAFEDTIRLDPSIGLDTGSEFVLRELYPQKGRIWGKPGAGTWKFGDTVPVSLDGTSATVLELVPATEIREAIILNAGTIGEKRPEVQVRGGLVQLTNIAGEPGTSTELGLFPAEEPIREVSVNGQKMPFQQHGRYLAVHIQFAGSRFTQAQQLALQPEAGGLLSGQLSVPSRVFEQLRNRSAAWPIPWTSEDYKTSWLAPERLLLFVQVSEPQDGMSARATLDGKPLVFERAYTSTRVHSAAFVGLYADVSKIRPDVNHAITLQLEGMGNSKLQGIFFDNVQPQWTTELTKPTHVAAIATQSGTQAGLRDH